MKWATRQTPTEAGAPQLTGISLAPSIKEHLNEGMIPLASTPFSLSS
jgi:hypothetical protein